MRIVLGIDGSEGARWATEMVRALPFPRAADVTAVAAVHVPTPHFTSLTPTASQAYGGALATMREEAEEAARNALAETARALEGGVTSFATELRDGPPADVLLEAARTLNADLVVVGSRGLGPVKEALLGSVSRRVAEHAPCSVLVVRGSAPELQRILVGVDGSTHAEVAVKFVAALELPPAVSVSLCAVAEEPFSVQEYAPRTSEALAGALRVFGEVGKAEAERVLSDSRSLLSRTRSAVVTSLRAGHAVEQLLAAIREGEPNLVVVGAKGRRAPEATPLGNGAPMILKYAPCSVVMARP